MSNLLNKARNITSKLISGVMYVFRHSLKKTLENRQDEIKKNIPKIKHNKKLDDDYESVSKIDNSKNWFMKIQQLIGFVLYIIIIILIFIMVLIFSGLIDINIFIN